MKRAARPRRLQVPAAGELRVITGCAGGPAPPAVLLDKDPEEHVTLPPATGSNLPRRVKVGAVMSGEAAGKGQAEAVDPEEFRRSLRSGRQLEPGR